MNYLQNHIWCSDSNWGGQYDCRHSVFFNSYEAVHAEDWKNVIDEKSAKVFMEEEYNSIRSIVLDEGRFFDDEKYKSFYNRYVPTLKSEVVKWLEENVKDRPKPGYDGQIKAWCIGSNKYNSANSSGFSLFFHRRKDAMAFIRRWSKWKKPVHYCQYFTGVRKKLDLVTLKYRDI
jgi:hypothetical protein